MSAKVVILLLALTVPAASPVLAQPRPVRPAPAPDPAARAYAAVPEAERQAIQQDLIWTGDYNGAVNADLNTRALAAVKTFQKRLKARETGVLDARERTALAAAAKQKRDAVGWRLQDDGATGARLGVPSKLLPQHASIIGGSRWSSAHGDVQVETFRIAKPGTTLQGVYDDEFKAAARKVSYKLARPDFFVLSGTQGAKRFYIRGVFKDREVRGFTILYDPATAATVDPIVIGMSNAYSAFPAKAVAIAPPPRRKVEYGTGVIVSPKGDVITSRELLEGCQTVTLAGLGPADIVAREKASGLALLRIYGARKLAPLALADAAPGADLTLVGIADPQSQAGGDKVTTATARVQTVAAHAVLEPPPQIGFAGAAAIDRAGRLAGIVDPAPQVVAGPPAAASGATRLIPVAAVRGFLTAQHVTVDAGAAAAPDAAKAAVARVICVRK